MTYYGEVVIGHDERGRSIEMTVEDISTLTDIAAGTPTHVTIRGQIKDRQ